MRKLSLSFVVCACAAISFSQVKLGSPAQTVESLVSALESGNVRDAARCVKNAKPSASVKRNLETIPAQGLKFSASLQRPSVKGANAIAFLVLTMTKPGQGSRSINETVKFEKVGSSWLIVAPKSLTSPESVINAVAFMLVNGDKNPIGPDPSNKTSVCMMNIKQLALATMMFNADHDDVFSFKAKDWPNSVMPYIKNKEIFTCPLDKPGTVSYSINTDLLGKHAAVVERPAQTVMIYEGKNRKLLFRHDGKAVVAFADGHARLISKDEAKNLVWKPIKDMK